MTLDPSIVPLLGGHEIKTNFIVEILAATPRRWTNYRGRTSDGRRGLIIGGNYYAPFPVTVPEIEESDSAPVRLTLTISNAENLHTDLYSDTANLKKPVTITKVWFSGEWSEAFAPTTILEPWFEGETGKPALRGEQLIIDCHANMGRRGKSPRKRSRSCMTTFAPISAGQKLTIFTRAA